MVRAWSNWIRALRVRGRTFHGLHRFSLSARPAASAAIRSFTARASAWASRAGVGLLAFGFGKGPQLDGFGLGHFTLDDRRRLAYLGFGETRPHHLRLRPHLLAGDPRLGETGLFERIGLGFFDALQRAPTRLLRPAARRQANLGLGFLLGRFEGGVGHHEALAGSKLGDLLLGFGSRCLDQNSWASASASVTLTSFCRSASAVARSVLMRSSSATFFSTAMRRAPRRRCFSSRPRGLFLLDAHQLHLALAGDDFEIAFLLDLLGLDGDHALLVFGGDLELAGLVHLRKLDFFVGLDAGKLRLLVLFGGDLVGLGLLAGSHVGNLALLLGLGVCPALSSSRMASSASSSGAPARARSNAGRWC